MKAHRRSLLALALSLVILSAACAPRREPGSTPPPEGGIIRGLAAVDSITILIMESFPVQVSVRALGNLPDGCTTIDSTTQERQGNTIFVTIGTARPDDALCAEVLVPFDKTISLDALGLKAGTYTVTVNAVSAQFTLGADNVAPEE